MLEAADRERLHGLKFKNNSCDIAILSLTSTDMLLPQTDTSCLSCIDVQEIANFASALKYYRHQAIETLESQISFTYDLVIITSDFLEIVFVIGLTFSGHVSYHRIVSEQWCSMIRGCRHNEWLSISAQLLDVLNFLVLISNSSSV